VARRGELLALIGAPISLDDQQETGNRKQETGRRSFPVSGFLFSVDQCSTGGVGQLVEKRGASHPTS
jgi:hypothetical protein